MRTIIALLRMAIAALALLTCAFSLLITGFLPFRHRGELIVRWVPVVLARLAMQAFNINIHIDPDDREQIRNHTGLLFANHDSMIDAAVVATIRPFRFLAKAEIENWFIIGGIAKRIGTVFFNREDKTDRARVREQLGESLHNDKTPVLLFPEGKINGKPQLEPFRYGAFRIGVENEIDILPAAITFDPFETASYFTVSNQAFFGMMWRLAKLPRMDVSIITLPIIRTTTTMDAPSLAEQTQANILTTLREKSSAYV